MDLDSSPAHPAPGLGLGVSMADTTAMSTPRASVSVPPSSSNGDKETNFHPDFSSPEADVVLGCKDGALYFRVHSFTLKNTSGWFRTMFSLPQRGSSSLLSTPTLGTMTSSPSPSTSHSTLAPSPSPISIGGPNSADAIHMDEDAHTVEGLLRMVCGLPIPPLGSYDSIEPLLYAAEKYDMPGPLSIIRMLVMTPAVIGDPLRLYAVACRYGWTHEAQYASTQSLTLDLQADEHRDALRKLSTDALLRLQELHWSRRQQLKKLLDDPPFVNAQDPHIVCSICDHTVDYHTWRELKYAIYAEMEVRPLGDNVLSSGLTDWPAAKACWNAKCANDNCARLLYDKGETLRLIRECMDKLPTQIKVPL